MKEILDEGLWDRIRDNEAHYSRLINLKSENRKEFISSCPSFARLSIDGLLTGDEKKWLDWDIGTGGTLEINRPVFSKDLDRLMTEARFLQDYELNLSRLMGITPEAMFFDMESTFSFEAVSKYLKDDKALYEVLNTPSPVLNIDAATSAAPKASDVQCVAGHAPKFLQVFSPHVKTNWREEMAKFQCVDDTEILETSPHPIPKEESDEMLNLWGTMLRTFSPELRTVAKMTGTEEATEIVLDSFPYAEARLDPLTEEEIAFHNPRIAPRFVIPKPKEKSRTPVSDRRSIAKASRKRAKAGRKKNRG